MEEIWGGRIWDRRCVSVCVSFCVSGLFGFDVRVEGRAVICALSGALRLTHSQGCVSPTVDSPHKGQRRVSMCNLMPDPWGGEERFLLCTWTAFSMILWLFPCVFRSCIVRHTESDTPLKHVDDCLETWSLPFGVFLYACLFVWDWVDRNCVFFLCVRVFSSPSVKLNLD